jgi:hypothetical protein
VAVTRARTLCATATRLSEAWEPARALNEWLRAVVVHITESRVLADAFTAAYEGPADIEPPQVAAWHGAVYDAALPLLTAARNDGAIRIIPRSAAGHAASRSTQVYRSD